MNSLRTKTNGGSYEILAQVRLCRSLQALATGQVDALGSSTTALVVLNRGKAQKEFERKLTLVENHFGIGVRRGQFDLLQWLNSFIYAIRIIPIGLLWGFLSWRTRSWLPALVAHGFNLWGLQNF